MQPYTKKLVMATLEIEAEKQALLAEDPRVAEAQRDSFRHAAAVLRGVIGRIEEHDKEATR